VFVVALGIHACPKVPMLKYRELAVAGQFRQWLAFQDAVLGL